MTARLIVVSSSWRAGLILGYTFKTFCCFVSIFLLVMILFLNNQLCTSPFCVKGNVARRSFVNTHRRRTIHNYYVKIWTQLQPFEV